MARCTSTCSFGGDTQYRCQLEERHESNHQYLSEQGGWSAEWWMTAEELAELAALLEDDDDA